MIRRENLQDLYPLSPLQEGMLHHWLLDPQSEIYREQITCQVSGRLDPARLAAAWRRVVRRHDVLRTVFVHEKASRPLQMVLRDVAADVHVEDLSDRTDDEHLRIVDARRRDARARGFDLTTGALMRVAIFHGRGQHHIVFTFHHIILDGWSVALLMVDLLEHYAADAGAPPAAAPVPFSRYIKFLDQVDRQASLQAWRDVLEGCRDASTIPSTRPGGRGPRRSATAAFAFDAAETGALTAFARGRGLTIAALLQGLWGVVLSRYQAPGRDDPGAHDVIFGIVVSGRDPSVPDVDRIVGLVTNTVPLRLAFRDDETIAAVLRRAGERSAMAQEQSHLPLPEIQAGGGRIDHVVAFENYPRAAAAAAAAESAAGFRVVAVDGHEESIYPLNLLITPAAGSLDVRFVYDASIYGEAQVRRLFGQLHQAALGAMASPDARVGDLDLVPPAEAAQIAGFSRGETVAVPEQTIPGRFAVVAAATPDAVAIIDGDRVLTYRQVMAAARALAHHLRAEIGVRAGERVAIVLERSAELPICALGVMQAGAAFVPIDPVLPGDRIAFMVADSACVHVLDAAALPRAAPERIVPGEAIAPGSPDDCAYVIYTSGSTGQPKGVANAHRGVVNLAAFLARELPIGAGDRLPLFASPSFDACAWETWAAWCNGAALVVASPRDVEDPRRYGQLLRRHACTLALLPPAYAPLVDSGDLEGLKALMTAGEAAHTATASALSSRLRFFNGYGPSETSIQATCHQVLPDDALGDSVPIGRPIQNVDTWVLDGRGRPAPIGAPGELHIGGIGVGLESVARADLTALRFPRDPDRPGRRRYRTGDLVRWLDDGTLVFGGRIDDQVKVRGYRVEPGEIEARLLTHRAVRQAAVIPVPHDAVVELAAFVVSGGAEDVDALRDHLRATLPEYMVPTRWVALPALPLTPQGKIDRAALAAMETRAAAPRTSPRTALEHDLHRIWLDVLGAGEVGIHDHFFDSGGHSLKAIRLAARIRKDLGHALSLRDLYERPTIAALAALVEARRPVARDPIPRVPDAPSYPASHAQRRLWLIEHMSDVAAYHISGAWLLDGGLDADALGRALDALVDRHESLRTTFVQVNGELHQRVRPRQGPVLVRRTAAADWQARLGPAIAERFDLEAGPLFRAHLNELDDRRHALIIVVHHIVADEWSVGILAAELSAIYGALTEGRAPELPALAVQLRDVSAWQRTRSLEAAREYWHRVLAGPLPVLALPTDHPRPRRRSSAGGLRRSLLDRAASHRLQAVARRSGGSLFTLLLAAVNALLYRYTGQQDLIVGYPAADRGHPDLDGQVGFLVNTMVSRTTMRGDEPFAELHHRVRQASLDALAHQDYPFDLLVQEIGGVRDGGRHPLFDVMVALAPDAAAMMQLPGVRVSPHEVPAAGSKFDLLFAFTETAAGLESEIEFSTDLFTPDTIDRLQRHLLTLLREVSAAPGTSIARVPLLDEAERALALGERGAEEPVDPGDTLVSRFAAAAAAHPEVVAVAAGAERMTYRELDCRSNRVAHRLIAGGAQPGDTIAVSLDRTPDLIAAILGILKTGAAYLPIEPALPPARQQAMREDAAAVVCVTAGFMAGLDDAPDQPVAARPRGDDLAYVLFTSGSTGRPNGVMIEHRHVVAHLDAYDRFAPPPRPLVATVLSSIGFDVSVSEIFTGLCRGGTLHLLPVELAGDPDRFVRALATERVTSAYVPPALVPPFVEALDRSGVDLALERVLVGVEPIPQGVLQAWRRRLPALRIVNGYGPTEATVTATFFDFAAAADPAARTPIGSAPYRYRVYVLDADLQLVPVGVHGEIYIGGAAVARGYVNNPALTADRFVPDPFGHGSRLYRTGDRARRLPDGHLEFIGRSDHQVKVRGVRVEPGEIVAALQTHPAVREAFVAVADEANGGKRLLAYIATGDAVAPSAAALRAHLRDRLAEAMIPAAFGVCAALPRNASGKVDRERLPQVEPVEVAAASGRTPTEELLGVIWAGVLGVDRVGRDENFFDAGGHSLAAMQVTGRVRDACGVELPLADVFERPTIAALAERVDTLRRDETLLLPPIAAVSADGAAPLSFAQQRLWFLEQLEPGTAYNVPVGVRLRGRLDVPALARAFEAVVARHDVLRTTFAAIDGVPVQQVRPPARVELPIEDVPAVGPGDRDAAIAAAASGLAAAPFDLSHDLPWRARLLRLAADDHALLVTFHHIAIDGWSVNVLLGEMAALYAAFSSGRPIDLPPLALQYSDVARWQRRWLDEGRLQPQVDHWARTLDGLPPALDLPTDHPRRADRRRRAGVERFVIDAGLTACLAQTGRALNATPFMTLLAAFNVLLARWSGQRDVAVGTPVANRTRPEIEPLIGFFANTLVIRTTIDGDADFAALVRRVREAALDAYAHQDVPFELLVETLQPERSLDHAPLFQVLFVMQARSREIAIPGLDVLPIDQPATTAKFDLTLSIEERGASLSAALEYDADLFDRASIQAMVGSFQALLAAIAADPHAPVRRLPMLRAEERIALVSKGEGPAPGATDAPTVLDRLARQAARTPGAIAVEDGGRSITYRELEARANQVAHRLLARGAGANVPIGLAMERSLEQVIALAGILKSGAGCLPLDPSYPVDRRAFMLADAGALHVVTLADIEAARGESTVDPGVPIAGGDLLYVLYTSGSTGRPKGVLFPHRILANLIAWDLEAAGHGAPARTLQFAPTSFDVSFQEIFTCWASGGTLVLIAEERRRDPDALLAFLKDRRIERLFVPFVALDALADAAADRSAEELPASLRQVITAGEQLRATPALRALFARLPGCELHNHYGPTEAHVVTAHGLPIDTMSWPDQPSIGRPIPGASVHVLDDDFEPVPRGVPGELYIGGLVVADGYLQRPDLTAERFVPDPFAAAGRLYRTGDRGRRNAAGDIEFLGRVDGQIKIRGFRVEPGEIETALARHPSVARAAVIADDRQRLIAYVVPSGRSTADGAQLQAHLRASLPDYMVPAAVLLVGTLPLTPSGKLDRRALPAPAPVDVPAEPAPPRTRTERRLAEIWQEVLGLSAVGIHETFFDLGGHSLLAARLASRIRRAFNVALPLRTLFEAPTIAGLASRIDGSAKAAAEPALVPAPRSAAMPCSFAQERLLYVSAAGGHGPTYNMPCALRLTGALDRQALAAALGEIVRRHEVLRTRLVEQGGRFSQIIDPAGQAPVSFEDLSAAADRDRRARTLVHATATRPFDLAREWPVRCALVRLEPDLHLLVLVLHHVAADGWSIGVLARELGALYDAFSAGRPSPLADLPVQYADYAVWQRAALSDDALAPHRAYWRAELAGTPARLALPAARPRPVAPSFRGDSVSFAIGPDQTAKLRALAGRLDVTLYTLLLTAYSVTLYRVSGQNDFVIATPTAGRTRPELEPLIGLFLNQVPIRVQPDGQPALSGLARELQRTVLEAFAREDLPFEIVVRDVAAERRPAGPAALADIFFALQNWPKAPLALGPVRVAVEPMASFAAKCDLAMSIDEMAEGLIGTLEFATDLFDRPDMEIMAAGYTRLLDAMVEAPDGPILEAPAAAGRARSDDFAFDAL